MPLARERFFLGHSVVANRVPKVIALKDYDRIKEVDRPIDLQSLGLFEVGAPDFNKYYPEVTAADLIPKDEDFAYPIARALSEIIINKYGPIDFTMGGTLKASVRKLVGQTLFTNHEAMVGNEVGVVMEAAWEAQREYDGFKIPAGINVKLKVDGKSNPKLVRSMQSDPPSVHSLSVTLSFKWEKSHPELADDQFWAQQGAYDNKGELIRRVVTEVFSYEEISLVSHGADPYAQIIKDGKIVNPGYADNRYEFSAADFAEKGHYFDWKDYATDKISLSADDTIPSTIKNTINSTKNDEPMNKEFLKFLREKLGLAETVSEADVIAKAQEMIPLLLTAQTNSTKLTGELTTANDSLTQLKAKYPDGTEIVSPEIKTKLAGYDSFKAVAEAATSSLKQEALRLYHLTCGGADKADASITKLISEASYETATALHKQYTATAEANFTAKCDSCGSTKISRASAAAPALGVHAGGEGAEFIEKTTEEVMGELTKPLNFSRGIHGAE